MAWKAIHMEVSGNYNDHAAGSRSDFEKEDWRAGELGSSGV